MTYEPLKDNNDFEILNIEPHTIRNTYTKKECTHYIRTDGYIVVSLNGRPNYFHKILSLQFKPNPNNYKCVRFIDGDKSNISLSNIEWCSRSEINSQSKRIKKRSDNELKEMVDPINLSRSQLRRWNKLHNINNITEVKYSECDSNDFNGFL